MTSRDEALKLARSIMAHVDDFKGPVASQFVTLARALIESEEERRHIRYSAREILAEFHDNMRRLTLMPMETPSLDMAVYCMERAIDAALRREEVRDG